MPACLDVAAGSVCTSFYCPRVHLKTLTNQALSRHTGTRQPAISGFDTQAHLTTRPAVPHKALPSCTRGVFRTPAAFTHHSRSMTRAKTCRLCHTRCQASNHSSDAQTSPDISPEVGKGKTLLIIGGTGRVGSSTAASLVHTHPNLKIILGTRGKEGYDAAVENRPSLKGLEYRILDRNKLDSILSALEGCDIVLHTAGPFQRKKECLVLEAAIQAKIPYLGDSPFGIISSSAYLQQIFTFCMHGMSWTCQCRTHVLL